MAIQRRFRWILGVEAFLMLSLFSCESPTQDEKGIEIELSESEKAGLALYNKSCKSCHGENGDLESGGAFDLSKSKIETDSIIQVIQNGRGAMPPYKYLYKTEQSKLISDYVLTLRVSN